MEETNRTQGQTKQDTKKETLFWYIGYRSSPTHAKGTGQPAKEGGHTPPRLHPKAKNSLARRKKKKKPHFLKNFLPFTCTVHFFDIPLHHQTRRDHILVENKPWRGGRVVDCTGLENRRTERYRGFESLSLR